MILFFGTAARSYNHNCRSKGSSALLYTSSFLLLCKIRRNLAARFVLVFLKDDFPSNCGFLSGKVCHPSEETKSVCIICSGPFRPKDSLKFVTSFKR